MKDLLIHNVEEKLNKESAGITGSKEKAMIPPLNSRTLATVHWIS